MQSTEFKDYYEVLQISSSAHADTIERVFRHLAQRYHPDNQDTGDTEQFQLVMEAHNILKDAEDRARYDLLRTEALAGQAFLVQEIVGDNPVESDELIQEKILSLLYIKCRQDMKEPGVGMYELMQMIQCPKEHMDFHLWYMKEKGWIRRTENGLFAISVAGVDRTIESRKTAGATARITDQSDRAIHL